MSPGAELHPERNTRIVALRLHGVNHALIAECVGTTTKVVGHVLARAGVVDRLADAETKARAVELAAEIGVRAAAERVRFSPYSVRRWVRQAKEARHG